MLEGSLRNVSRAARQQFKYKGPSLLGEAVLIGYKPRVQRRVTKSETLKLGKRWCMQSPLHRRKMQDITSWLKQSCSGMLIKLALAFQ